VYHLSLRDRAFEKIIEKEEKLKKEEKRFEVKIVSTKADTERV